MLLLSWLLLACFGSAFALTVTNPSVNEVVDYSKEYTIKWTFDASDAQLVSINIVNVTTPQDATSPVTLIRSCNITLGEYKIHWRDSIRPASGQYQLMFWDYNTHNYVSQSKTFDLAPASATADTQNQDDKVNDASQLSTTEDSDNSQNSQAEDNMVSEAIIPTIVGIVLMSGGISLCFRIRRRRQTKKKSFKGPMDMNLAVVPGRESRVPFDADIEAGEHLIPNRERSISPPPRAVQSLHAMPSISEPDPFGDPSRNHVYDHDNTSDHDSRHPSERGTDLVNADISLLRANETPGRFSSLYGKPSHDGR